MSDLMMASTARQVAVMGVVHHHQPGVPTREEHWSPHCGGFITIVRVRTFGRFLYAPVSPGFGRVLEQAARAYRPDIVHAHMPNLSAFWMLRSRSLAQVPWVVHWHADVGIDATKPTLAFAYRAYRMVEQSILRRAARVIVTSPPYLQASEPLRPWHSKCTVIPLGLDATHLTRTDVDEPPSSPFSSRAALKLLFVGRLSAYKGLEYLIEAVAAAQDVELVIAGEGDELQRVEALVRRLGVKSKIKLLGRVDDGLKVKLFQQADVVCLPSINRHEAFGLVLLEAMACGVPVIATRVPGSGMQWVVNDGRTGWLVEPHDSAAIAKLLEELVADSRLLRRAGRAAKQDFSTRFDIGAVAENVIRLYHSISGASTGAECDC